MQKTKLETRPAAHERQGHVAKARIGPAPRSRAAAIVLGRTAARLTSDTVKAKGSAQSRCPSVTVTQDGFTRDHSRRLTDKPRPWIVPGTNIANRMNKEEYAAPRVMARKASAAARPIGVATAAVASADDNALARAPRAAGDRRAGDVPGQAELVGATSPSCMPGLNDASNRVERRRVD